MWCWIGPATALNLKKNSFLPEALEPSLRLARTIEEGFAFLTYPPRFLFGEISELQDCQQWT